MTYEYAKEMFPDFTDGEETFIQFLGWLLDIEFITPEEYKAFKAKEEAMATFITSDWHFDHDNICGKDGFVPTRTHFESVEEMNEEIIKQINSVATKDDVLYHLGDIGLGKPKRLFELLERINPRIVLIAGNHDSFSKTMKYIAKNNYVVDKNGNMRYTIYEVGTRHKHIYCHIIHLGLETRELTSEISAGTFMRTLLIVQMS